MPHNNITKKSTAFELMHKGWTLVAYPGIPNRFFLRAPKGAPRIVRELLVTLPGEPVASPPPPVIAEYNWGHGFSSSLDLDRFEALKGKF